VLHHAELARLRFNGAGPAQRFVLALERIPATFALAPRAWCQVLRRCTPALR